MLRKIVKPEESVRHPIPLEALIQEIEIIYYTAVHFVDIQGKLRLYILPQVLTNSCLIGASILYKFLR